MTHFIYMQLSYSSKFLCNCTFIFPQLTQILKQLFIFQQKAIYLLQQNRYHINISHSRLGQNMSNPHLINDGSASERPLYTYPIANYQPDNNHHQSDDNNDHNVVQVMQQGNAQIVLQNQVETFSIPTYNYPNNMQSFPTFPTQNHHQFYYTIPNTNQNQVYHYAAYYLNPDPQSNPNNNLNIQSPITVFQNNQHNNICEYCHKNAYQIQRKRTGCATWSWCMCIYCFTGICCWIPFVIDDCYDLQIICSNCEEVREIGYSSYGC